MTTATQAQIEVAELVNLGAGQQPGSKNDDRPLTPTQAQIEAARNALFSFHLKDSYISDEAIAAALIAAQVAEPQFTEVKAGAHVVMSPAAQVGEQKEDTVDWMLRKSTASRNATIELCAHEMDILGHPGLGARLRELKDE